MKLRDVAMAAVDFVEFAIEESPNNEPQFASTVAPYRKSTNKLYPPARTARLSPTPTPLSRSDELRGISGEVRRLADDYAPSGSFSSRAYGDLMTWLFDLAGFDGTYTAGGALVTNPNKTTATGVNALNSAVVNVGDTTSFPATGTFIMSATAVTYTGKTATSFTGCSNHPATTGGEAINGNVPTGANKWVFAKRSGTVVARTAKIRTNYAPENVCLEGYGFALSSLGIAADASVTADLMGLYMRRLAADTSTTPAIPASTIYPFRRGDLYVSALANGGTLSDFTIAIANSLERVKSMSLPTPSLWPDQMELGDDQVQVSGTIPKRVLTGVDMDALISATSFAMTARWLAGGDLVGTTNYGMWAEFPAVQIVGGDADELQDTRRRGVDLSWFAAWDETAGYDARFTLVNGIAAVETYV